MPQYLAARERFHQVVAVNRRARRQRLVLAAASAMSVATLAVSGSAWMASGYVSSGLGRLDAGISGTPADGPVNVLVAAVDTRGGLTRRQQLRLHVGAGAGTNTDTMMLVHIPADHQSVQAVSLPRDSWVKIPGHGMNKINAAFGLGGPALMVSTVERATGLRINDYVEIDYLGFVHVIDALGGVEVCLPFAVNDQDSGLHLSAGRHHVDGVTALKFARDRHSFAASDLARIADQQQLMSSVLAQVTAADVITNPLRLQQVLSSVTNSVTVDRGINVAKLASEMRGIKPADVSFTTVPIATADYRTPTGQSAVLWNQRAAATLFHRVDTGNVLAGSPHQGRPGGRVAGQVVRSDPAPARPRTAAQDACR
ncbi:MAG: LCP family protein [Actinobacteria bacterium]|nr:LCP family protein [Actinomycetota bacterium]